MKPVAFHITRQEYDRLKAECAAGGARSLPELIRAKVLRGVNGHSLAGVADQLDRLEHALQQLSKAVHRTPVETSGASHGRQ